MNLRSITLPCLVSDVLFDAWNYRRAVTYYSVAREINNTACSSALVDLYPPIFTYRNGVWRSLGGLLYSGAFDTSIKRLESHDKTQGKSHKATMARSFVLSLCFLSSPSTMSKSVFVESAPEPRRGFPYMESTVAYGWSAVTLFLDRAHRHSQRLPHSASSTHTLPHVLTVLRSCFLSFYLSDFFAGL